jgi:hypothetical protein
MMLRRLLPLLSSLLAAGGCAQAREESLVAGQPGSFTLQEVGSSETADGTLKTWQATSRSHEGPPFTFRLEMVLKTPQGDTPFCFSNGAILRDPGKDGTLFLKEVAHVIQAIDDVPQASERVDRLDVSTAFLGTSLSRQGGNDVIAGTFSSKPGGNWICFKLFLADGEGEVYVNINPVLGQGEISIKDPEYAEAVLREFAKVWLP